jgi:phage repressor protein C with HTH and peptisase S24 domain
MLKKIKTGTDKSEVIMATSEDRKATLKRLINASGNSVADFCRSHDLDPSYISQLLNGHRNIGEKAARKIEAKSGLAEGYLDIETQSLQESPSFASSDKYAFIKQYDVKAACGDGYYNGEHIEVKNELAFRKSWLKETSLQEKHLSIITAHGDSMWPTINEGAILLLNSQFGRLESGKVYALLHNGEVRVKRLFAEFTGAWRIASDNPNKTLYPDNLVDAEAMSGLQIIGRVVWAGGEL